MKLKTLSLIMMCAAATGCGSKKDAVEQPATEAAVLKLASPVMSNTAHALPKAIVYKMTGDATAANVPVQMQNGEVIGFPAPTDVVGQEPLQMADGYLLDRRGIGANSVYTKWTYAEYSALKQAPSIAEIKAAIIPGARATQIHVLPMTLSTALSDTAAVNRLIRQFKVEK